MLLSSPGHARLVDTRIVDWDRIRDWIGTCSTDPQHLDCRPMDLTLDGFRVIDCLSRAVGPLPPGAKYAALSYVWGPSEISEPLLDGGRLPASTQMAIEDAMHCTTRLGFRYLWVDRYCIDQASPSKHLQIHNMDLIYGCASVTIVNAAGDDSDCGLPGVSVQSRIAQESFVIGGKRFLQIPQSEAEIKKSKWASRGWTLQEGHLSKVRLVFTRSQVIFQCRTRHSCESVAGDFKNSARSFIQDPRSMQPFVHYDRHSPGNWWYVFRDLLSGYLSRSLKYESDILVAFQAIFKSLEVIHLWGIPFRSNEGLSLDRSLIVSLSWIPRPYSNTNTRLVLREGFPTWSWAAWKGKWSILPPLYRKLYYGILETDLAVTTDTGQRRSLAEYCSIMENTAHPNQFLPFLDIQSWIALVQFRRINPEDTLETFSTPETLCVLDKEGRDLDTVAAVHILNMELPGEPDFNQSRFLVGTWPLLLFIEQNDSEVVEVEVSGLVLKPGQDGTYQRLGVLEPILGNLERKGEDRLHLRSKYGKVILECERRSIRLA